MTPARPDEGPTRKQRREQARGQRKTLEAEELARAARRKRMGLVGGVLALVVAAAIVLVVVAGSGGGRKSGGSSAPTLKLGSLSALGTLKAAPPPGPLGPEGVPIPNAPPLAGTESVASGNAVDGIECSAGEQTLFHIHAHLTLFVNGSARQVPYGIGIPGAQPENTPRGAYVARGSCFYWLHTHAADGIIHIESPVQRTFTLGDFFDIWGQQLSATQLGPAVGPVTALYNGKPYEGDPRDIPLNDHAQIQLEAGKPLVSPVKIEFPESL